MQRILIYLISLTIGVLPSLAQETKSAEDLKKDSIYAYVHTLEKHNLEISAAYNAISRSLISMGKDSVHICVKNYINVVDRVYAITGSRDVAPYLQNVKTAYLKWINTIRSFNSNHLLKLEDYALTKRNMLKEDPEADIIYIDNQIAELFQTLDDVQINERINYLLELDNL